MGLRLGGGRVKNGKMDQGWGSMIFLKLLLTPDLGCGHGEAEPEPLELVGRRDV
jgi:hypothetical protein